MTNQPYHWQRRFWDAVARQLLEGADSLIYERTRWGVPLGILLIDRTSRIYWIAQHYKK